MTGVPVKAGGFALPAVGVGVVFNCERQACKATAVAVAFLLAMIAVAVAFLWAMAVAVAFALACCLAA